MEEKYIVYLHINKTNNKVYVGITSMAVNNREKRVSTRKALGHYAKDMPWLARYRLGKGKDSPLFGKAPSENTLLAHRKIILQFNLDGEFIKEFNSIKEASEEIGVSKSAIVHCLKGKTKKAGGYKWKYKYE